ncbi:succinyl-CoA synthetase subunit alpha [Diaporthe helianthi]|uniref:Succinyl-CoA synthetase subunit alpha n=1 Tax=Diaporthe helianthi TaxID=158607 RepID=A0A2P5I7V2_DIAHE|nr:succinyl-CoA synthetase subunit alpha [Diaporthe helianthi]
MFGSSSCRLNYAATLENLRIGSKTRVIFQGFTGRQATANAQESIAWGTNVVGGVTPGKESEHLGLPVLPSVRRAMDELKPDATGIYVPASKATPAIEEAIEAEVPLIVAVAEHIPLHDMLRIHSMLKTQTKSRLVGPNSPGIISSAKGERCRIGFQPLPCFSDGCVGIAAKSGTLSYEAVASTTRAGLGQSLCIGVGGDVLPGTDLVEALQVLEHDPNTKGIALIGEIGGDGEILAAQWITDYHARTPLAQRKPIVALIAGLLAPRDRVMGHAGAFWLPGEPAPNQKVMALRGAGVTMVNHPAKIGPALRTLMEDGTVQPPVGEIEEGAAFDSTDDFSTAISGGRPSQQRRGLHTSARRPSNISLPSRPQLRASSQQTRGLHLDTQASKQLLKEALLGLELQYHHCPTHYLALCIDRATRSQCLMTAIHTNPKSLLQPSRYDKILLPPSAKDVLALDGTETWHEIVTTLMAKLQISERPGSAAAADSVGKLLRDLGRVFRDKEAKYVGLQFGMPHNDKEKQKTTFPVYDLRIELDDAAARSAGRLADVHYRYAAKEARDPGAREAKAEGIVYHRLSPGNRAHNIGTLVNGAGLAMNTVDALAGHGGLAANFLDTGGKATSETVRRSFEIILKDDRVKVVFVNIFGGLTLGDMIARGIVLAYKEVDIRVPVVVRIRGTNEEEGQRIIAESGLPLYAFDDFEEAAEKAVELVSGVSAAKKVAQAVHESEGKIAELKKSIQLAAAGMLPVGGSEPSEEAAAPVDEATESPCGKTSESADDAPKQGDMAQEHTGKPRDSEKPEVADTIETLGSDHVA